MSSVNIEAMRSVAPGRPDRDAARTYAEQHGYVAIVRYRASGATEYTHIGTCSSDAELRGYLLSRHCHGAEVIYDGRAGAIGITEVFLLKARCETCGRRATRESLTLGMDNDFYVCPRCSHPFCDACYGRLPLTGSPGHGICPECRIQVQRAIPGFFGDQSGAS